MKIPLGLSDCVRPFAARPSILVWNAYYEQSPTNLEDGVSLIRRPAVRQLLEVGSGPIRKAYYRRDLFDNDFFVISGDTLFRVERTGPAAFTSTAITGTLDELYKPSVAASGQTLFVTDQVALYQTDGTAALAEIATPDDVTFNKLLYIGGYIVCVVKDSQRFYWIAPGEIVIDPLNFAEAESAPDWIVDAAVIGDQMYLFGGATVEVWYLSGDIIAPFQRIQGKLMETGVLPSSACVVSNTDTLFFISGDGTARVGAQMSKVSNPGVEERLRRAIANNNLSNL